MRFLQIIAIVSITLIGCKKTTEITENPQQENTTIAQEESVLVVTEEATDESTTEAETPIVKKSEPIENTIDSEPKTSGKHPKIQFQQKTFDYGMIEQGDKVQHQFTFTNTGNADLIIKDAQASCGCTTPSYPFVPIKPGESASIGVTFSSVGKMGTQRPTITVTSNTHPKVTTLHLEGFVTDKLEKKNPVIEPNVNINTEDNVTKGGEIIKKEKSVKEDN